jgi:MFS family permease
MCHRVRTVGLRCPCAFTPLAAGAAALLVSKEEGAAAISSVLLGWALAIAVGLPLISLTAPQIGWVATYALIGGLAALSFLALLAGLPRGIKGAPVVFATSRAVGRSRALVLLLLTRLALADRSCRSRPAARSIDDGARTSGAGAKHPDRNGDHPGTGSKLTGLRFRPVTGCALPYRMSLLIARNAVTGRADDVNSSR